MPDGAAHRAGEHRADDDPPGPGLDRRHFLGAATGIAALATGLTGCGSPGGAPRGHRPADPLTAERSRPGSPDWR
ncbi:hypothetical protein ABT168_32225, partial [Streptomyces sp. NPDC001793]